MMRNKKGAGVDNFFVIASFFAFILFMLVILVFWNVATSLSFWAESTVGNQINANAQKGFDAFDFIIVMAWLSLHIGILITAFLLRDHPVMYIVALLLAVILPLVAAPISNAWETVLTDATLGAEVSNISMSNYIMNNLPMFEVIWSLLTIVVLIGMARIT